MKAYEDRRRDVLQGLNQKFDKKDECNIVVARTPWNLYASIAMSSFKNFLKTKTKSFVASWVSFAMEYLNQTSYYDRKIQFNYDEWFKSENYRRKISEALGVKFSDKGSNRVSNDGKGSSVDSVTYDNRAQETKVLDRWRGIIADPKSRGCFKLRRIMKRRIVRGLARKIFGDIPVELRGK